MYIGGSVTAWLRDVLQFMDNYITRKLAQKAAGKVEDVNNSEGLADGTIDPVAYMQAVVFRQLYSGYKSEYAVLEHQHENSRESSETGQK